MEACSDFVFEQPGISAFSSRSSFCDHNYRVSSFLKIIGAILRCALAILGLLAAQCALAQGTENPMPARSGAISPAYSALMNGVRVNIPPEDQMSASFVMKPGGADQAAVLNLILREGSFRPILTREDANDWRANWLKPYAVADANHRWLVIALIPAVAVGPESNTPGDLFQHLTHDAGLTDLVCDGLKHGLDYCAGFVPGEIDIPNEFFFDSKNRRTLIACSNIPRIKFRHCTHYFNVDAVKSIAQLSYSSEEEIVSWKFSEEKISRFIETFPRSN